MEAKKSLFFYGLIITLIICGGLYYFLREESLEDSKQESVVTRMAFNGTSMVEEQNGRKLWELTARIMEVDSKTHWVYMTDMVGIIHREDGSKIDFTAPSAVVDPKTRDIEMTGRIDMKASDGATFSADKGRYVAKDRRIFASGSIHATKDDAVLTANEMETDDKFEHIIVKGNAHVVKGGSAQ